MIPRSVTPLVSVVIVTHGGGQLLTDCVATLRRNTRESLEVIVLDSASPDGTGEWARRALPGVKVHNSAENHGFGAMSNAGVLDASAPYVCFLNADVLVEPNWLPPLLEVLETQENVGAVAPLMLNPDRSVQENGSIVRADGWAQAWTERTDFRRPVDYASGACLLVRRKAFTQVGGFAPEYRIAYFEDTDLAFSLRAAGWATVVEPRSVVVHERHGISGSSRALELMEFNHGIFAAKWAAELAGRFHVPADELRPHHLAHARDLTALERILVIDDSGDPRTRRIIEGLRSPERAITVLVHGREGFDAGPDIEVVADVGDVVGWLARRFGCYDVVVVSGPRCWEWAAHAVDTCQPVAVRLYNASVLTGRQDVTSDYHELETTLEAEAFAWADLAVCADQEDVDWVAREVSPPTMLRVVGYPASGPVADHESRSGVLAFDDVPAVWQELRSPGLRLTLLGIASPDDDQVDVIGRVPNPSWWRGRSLLHLAPVTTPGLQTGLIESMAAGLPFVTTPLGAEGLHLGSLTERLVATSVADMAEQGRKLLSDHALWIDVQDQLVELAGVRFSPSSFRRELNDALLCCGLAPV